MRVVIIDDSRVLRERLGSLIADLPGVELAGTAEGPRQGMALLARVTPDLVVLDLRFPDGNGLDLLAAIRRTPRPPAVIMFTNQPTPQLRSRCLEAGAEHFFDKTAELEALLATIQHAASS